MNAAKDVFEAANNGNAQALATLLERNASVDYVNWEGNGPLHAAARKGHLDCLAALSHVTADVNRPNADGFAALHLAGRNGHVECLNVLLGAGADKDAGTKRGATALHLAALGGHWECVMALLLAGADTTAQDMSGRTPLAVASTDAVRELLRNPVAPASQLGELEPATEGASSAALEALLGAEGEAEPPGSPAPSVAQVPEDVAALLASVGLSGFGAALAGPAVGVETAEDVALLHVEDLTAPGRGVGMSTVQARRLLAAAAARSGGGGGVAGGRAAGGLLMGDPVVPVAATVTFAAAAVTAAFVLGRITSAGAAGR